MSPWLKSILLPALLPLATHLAHAEDCDPGKAPLVPIEKEMRELTAELKDECSGYELREARAQYEKSFPASRARVTGGPGKPLEGTPEEIRILQKVLLGSPPSNWLDAVFECRTVKCALTRLYGTEEAALRVLSLAQDTGYILSASQERANWGREGLWSPEEIRIIDRAVRKLPPKFWHLKTLERFLRLPKRQTRPFQDDIAVFADIGNRWVAGAIEVNDLLHLGSRRFDNPERLIVHEIAHHFDYSNGGPDAPWFNVQSGFDKLSSWRKLPSRLAWLPFRGSDHEPDPKASFVSKYSQTTPWEDFAESASFYLDNPQLLNAMAPEKYDFLKNKVFDGREFVGREEWPRANKASQENAALFSRSFMECVRLMSPIDLSENFLLLNQRATLPSEIISESGCLNPYFDRLREALRDDPLYCRKKAEGLPEKWIRDAYLAPFDTFLLDFNDFTHDPGFTQPISAACGGRAKWEASCVLDVFLKSDLRSSGGLDLLDAETKKAILAHLASQIVLKKP